MRAPRALWWVQAASSGGHSCTMPFLRHSGKGKAIGERFCQDLDRGTFLLHGRQWGCPASRLWWVQDTGICQNSEAVYQKEWVLPYVHLKLHISEVVNSQNSSFPCYFTRDHYPLRCHVCPTAAAGTLPNSAFRTSPGGWTPDVVRGLTPWKLGNTTNQGLFCWVSRLKVMKKMLMLMKLESITQREHKKLRKLS